MAKIPKRLQARLIDVHQRIEWFAGIITRHKASDPSLPKWFSNKPVAYYQGLLFGAYTQVEDILNDYNAYKGFRFLDGYPIEEDFRAYYC